MNAERKCRACDEMYLTDPRNRNRQEFCSQPECQSARRTRSQRNRREQLRKGQTLTRRMKPSEAAWLRRNPLIVGLISTLIGSTSMSDIEAFCEAASERGARILKGDVFEDEQSLVENQELKG